MKEILEALDLSKNAANIYHSCLGEIPLSYEEIHSFEPSLSDAEFNGAIEELIQRRLFFEISPTNPEILPHYMAVPPFSTLFNKFRLDSKGESGSLQDIIETKIDKIIANENRIEVESIYNDFQKISSQIDTASTELRKDAEEFVESTKRVDNTMEIISNFELKMKNALSSQYNSLMDAIIQFRNLVIEILKASEFNEQQLESFEKIIRNDLEMKVQEKSKETEQKIFNEFNDLSEKFKSLFSGMLNNQVEQKAISLGILNFVDKEMSNLNNSINAKRESFKVALGWLKNTIKSEINKILKEQNAEVSESILSLNEFLTKILVDYFTLNNFWTVNSYIKTKEEISNLLTNASDNILLVVPNIDEYIPLEKLKEFCGKFKARIISSEPHGSSIVQELKNIDNLQYKRLKFNKFIGVISSKTAIIGEINKDEDNPLKSVTGFGTNSISLLELIEPILLKKWEDAKFSKNTQIVNGFNKIIENINDIQGKNIAEIMQDVLDLVFKMEGISLNVVEIKLLVSKLKKIDSPLDKDKKKEVIQKIRVWNDQFTKLQLRPTPEFRLPFAKDGIPLEPILDAGSLLEESETIELEKIEQLFDLFLEKVGELKGVDLSQQIQNMINLSLRFQGFSKVIEWKEELSTIDTILDEPFKIHLQEDFSKWKNDILRPILQKRIVEEPVTEAQVEEKIEEIIEEEYISPGLSQSQYDEEVSELEEQKLDINDLFKKISENVNDLKGNEISIILQDISDLLVESHGPMASKATRQWISKLRSIRGLLEDDIKVQFIEDLDRIKSKYVLGESEGDDLSDYTPGFMNDDSTSIEIKDSGKESSELDQLFEKVIKNAKTVIGSELAQNLQDIADIVMENHGSLAARDIRPWVSKLRSIRAPLEDDIKVELLEILEMWKEKFG